MKYVKVSAKVERRVENLRQSGKEGNVIEQKVKSIIKSLTSGTIWDHGETIGSYTKYGEERIKNCQKYDLGCGYRLITLQRGVKVFITFLGTHDECQRWLENNSRLKEIAACKGTIFRISYKNPMVKSSSNADTANFCGDEVPMNLSDQDLRRVFCGLVEGAKKRLR